MTPLSWENWIERYQRQGYRVLAPAWPGMDGDVGQLRRDPSPIAEQRVDAILDHHERVILNLDTPPIILGHSFGGAFVQVLLSRGLGAAGVGIAPAAVRGVRDLPLSTLRSSWSLLRNPLNRHKAIPLTAEQFHYAFANTLTAADSAKVYDRYFVPGSRNVLLEGASSSLNPKSTRSAVFGKDDRAPLLLIAGGADHVVPASVNRSNFAKYRHSNAMTAIEEYPGRTHYTLGQDGWEEVADKALAWSVAHAATEARYEATRTPRRDAAAA
jgi:alpha-beta hydrolase superfamily lysophospholipase